MFSVSLICMGKLKEKFDTAAASEYEKRLQGYCQFKLLELPEVRLPENASPAEIAAALKGADPKACKEELVRYALRAMVMKG